MVYLEILVGDQSFHGKEALTYSSPTPLPIGTLVFVQLRDKIVPGIVSKISAKKPSFKLKKIERTPPLPPLPKETIDLIYWMQDFYAAPIGAIVQNFVPKALPQKLQLPEIAQASQIKRPSSRLTDEQTKAIAAITTKGTHILHGATGSGKTRIYIELALKAMQNKKSALVLTPEIGLTSQLASTFKEVFGERVIVLHSQLTLATRRSLWLKILISKEPLVVIGARSALFCPMKSLGVLIIDEAHETAFKQDSSPYYHATHVASKLASLLEIPLIIGSATPLVTDYYFAEKKRRPIITMTKSAIALSNDTKIIITDLRDRSRFTKKSHLSDDLIEAISSTLSINEQTLLFLNKRGTARAILCDSCGWRSTCPHCDIPLVYHNDTHLIRCHSCNFQATPLLNCPECHNNSILFKSAGTKAIFEEVQKLFPNTKIKRFDTDNIKDERFEQHYNSIRNGDVDILVGTQTLAKGLDLPKLGLVGIIDADSSLSIPDFSSQERTYQLLSQVIGRVGRGHTAGKVFIQTYNPNNQLLKSVINKDWQDFYNNELEERKHFLFPPFCYLLKLWCRRATNDSAQKNASKFAAQLREKYQNILVEGPAPSFHEKVGGQYQWQIIVKAKERTMLTEIARHIPPNWQFDIDPMNLL